MKIDVKEGVINYSIDLTALARELVDSDIRRLEGFLVEISRYLDFKVQQAKVFPNVFHNYYENGDVSAVVQALKQAAHIINYSVSATVYNDK